MNYKFKTDPYKHQLTALEKSWSRETYAYFMEMGTGKTKVLIDNAAMLYDKGKIDGLLIVAPKGVIGTWYNQELPAHLPDHVENISVLWKSNITQKQKAKLAALKAYRRIAPAGSIVESIYSKITGKKIPSSSDVFGRQYDLEGNPIGQNKLFNKKKTINKSKGGIINGNKFIQSLYD